MTVPTNGDWVQLYGGRVFYPLSPTPEQIDVSNIAHALSLLCRYGGHCNRFYSVAQHSVHCHDMAPDGFEFEALMHDACEAYLVDIPRPIKYILPDYLRLEKSIEEVICKKFDLPFPMSKEVKLVDNRMLHTEKLQLMSPCDKPWMDMPDPYVYNIPYWNWQRANAEFLDRFKRYV